MTRPFPADDPFPPQATKQLSRDPATLSEAETSSLTLMRPAIRRTVETARKYVSRYGTAPAGEFIALIGEHGSGKTHTVMYVAQEVAADWPPRKNDRSPFQLTVKIETPDIVSFYRNLFAQIKPETLVNLMELARDQIAIDEFKSTPEVPDEAAEGIRNDRAAAERLLTNYLVDRGKVAKRQAEELGGGGEGRADFQRALPFLLGKDVKLADSAYRWIADQPASADELSAIGVSGPLRSVEMIKSALEILAALFGRARRPLLLYIDQFEKLVVGPNVALAENISVLRRLIDVVPDERGMLLIAGTPDAWRVLPRDVQERFGQNVIELPILTKKEASDLIRIFLDGGKQTEETDLFPFTQEAVDALARFCRGNIRRFLQSCSTLYREARTEQEPVDLALVEKAIRGDILRPPAEESEIRETIERLLNSSGMPWRRNFHVYRRAVDYAIVSPDERPRVAIEITRAVYKDDETRRADQLVRLAEDVRNVGSPQSSVIAVVVGYSTREVAAVIGPAVRQIFYDSRSFADDFRAALAENDRPPAHASAAPQAVDFEKELRLLRAELQRMQVQRDGEAEVLQERLRELLKGAAPAAPPPTVDFMTERWQDERQRLVDDIARVRRDRRAAEFQKLRRAADTIESDRKERHIQYAVISGLVMLIALSSWLAVRASELSRDPGITSLIYLTGFAGIAYAVFTIISFLHMLERRDLRRLTRRADSLDDLEQLRIEDPGHAYKLLFHPHPQVRFVAARSAHHMPDSETIQRMTSEPLTLIRRAQANALARTGFKDIKNIPDRVPEAVYIAAELTPGKEGVEPDNKRQIASAVCNGWLMSYFEAYGDPEGLNENYESGVRPAFAARRSRSVVKTALRMLSPYEDDGLGCFEDLKNIQTIDDLFLFWSQVLFFMERAK